MSTPVTDVVKFTVYGEPASKANSRKIVQIKGRPAVIKSKKAQHYVASFSKQCPQIDPPLEGDLKVTMTIYYASRRPDLDESVVLDCMQSQFVSIKVPGKTKPERRLVRANIYRNDRQVKEKHIFWALDRDNPRVEVKVETLGD